ncbi:MAG: triose-phosphate isomerase [candidate division WOR-3 bacterium]
MIPLIVGNWKMNKTPKEAKELAQELKVRLADVRGREIVICPPFTSLPVVSEVIKDSNLKLGAQNMHYELKGAYTGEVSGEFLKEIGCQYVIIGHSERRKYFREDDELINKKLKTALKIGLLPIFCVGEELKEREENKTFTVIENQIRKGLEGIENIDRITIAYEPVWAIGTGKNATPEQAAEVHNFIRNLLSEIYNREVILKIRIIYGGSVTPDNIDSLMAKEEINGVLVGGASLKVDSFVQIIKFH